MLGRVVRVASVWWFAESAKACVAVAIESSRKNSRLVVTAGRSLYSSHHLFILIPLPMLPYASESIEVCGNRSCGALTAPVDFADVLWIHIAN